MIDVVEAITGQVKSNAGKTLERVKESHPEVYPNLINYRFPGRGQRDTPIADVRGIVEIVMLLPGRHAARVRRQAAELLCRYLGGDLALVDEVCRIRGFQEELAAAVLRVHVFDAFWCPTQPASRPTSQPAGQPACAPL